MEPADLLAVEPVCEHGAVELGWIGHLAMLFPEVSTQVPEGYTYVTTVYPTGARASVVERGDDNLTAEEMRQRSAAVQAARVKELLTWRHCQ
eukprot:11172027-Lingulodinium_polyedra.AAC.1